MAGRERGGLEPGLVLDDPVERIARLRKDIARIDQQILALVAWRLEVAEEIGHHKRLGALPIRNFRAEVEVLQRARATCVSLGIDPEIGQALLQVLIEAAVGRQHGLTERQYGGGRKTVLVVGGCGRMGRWLCNFFAAQGHQVSLCDPAPDCVEGFPRVESVSAAAAEADVVVLCTPVGVTRETLETVLRADPRGLVFDICSLKSPLVGALRGGVRQGYRVASVHPLFAPDTILLTGRILLVCDCGNEEAATEARSLFEDTALRIVDVPLDRHDRYMAYVLGLSHAVNIAFASTLAASGLTAHELDGVASTTFAKQSRTTREVTMENAQLYYEIQHSNPHTAPVLEGLAASVKALEDAALQPDSTEFVRLMEANRRYLESG